MQNIYVLMLAAAIGGALGAVWASAKRQRESVWVVVLEVIMGAIAATAVNDLYRVGETPTVSALIGTFTGMTSGFVLDTLSEILPDFSKGLVANFFKRFKKDNDTWQ